MADSWIDQIFDAQQVAKGGVVRRQRSDVDRLGPLDDLVAEVKRRGFHMVQIGDQLVILCNKGDLKVFC
jgi:hypothetical protein